MRADAVLSLPSTITTWLVDRGFGPIKQVNVTTLPDMYVANLALRTNEADLLRGTVLAGGPMNCLKLGLTCYCHSPSSWLATQALLTDIVTGLFERARVTSPRDLLTEAFDAREDRTLAIGDLTLEVVFPEREPDQDFDVVSVSLWRPLRQHEWEGWLSEGLISAAHDEQKQLVDAMEAACRRLLERNRHPLADRSLTHFMTSDDDGTLMGNFHTAAGESLWLRMEPKGEASLGIVYADGRLEEL
jgi:hypothetical protein